MKGPSRLRVILIKPSKYDPYGYVERFRWGFMPNSTLPFLRSMTPEWVDGCRVTVTAVDEYVQTDFNYLDLLQRTDCPTLLAVAGVQSHQFQRALDLAAFAKDRGVEHAVIGGPHPMTCDTTMLQRRGISFALAEAEVVWAAILRDAILGELEPNYGQRQRWQQELDSPVLVPPNARDLRRYVVPMLGIYPARGCPFRCNFCSVIKIAGKRVRSQGVEITLQSLLAAKTARIRFIMFTSDNFNKYPEAKTLLRAMIDAKIDIPFFVQCDTQIVRDEEMVELLARAGCWQMFVGVESFDRTILAAAKKHQNKPADYGEIVRLCSEYGILAHFSNILGFPEQTEVGILEHLRVLRSLWPDAASFYILTPVPGTEQYDDFFSQGLIFEENLDRYDGSCLVWRHPYLTSQQLTDLMFRCYREFFSLSDVVSKWRRCRWRYVPWSVRAVQLGYGPFNRLATYRRAHPMSGGVGRVYHDSVEDYIELRRKRFGFERVPLPTSLELSESDKQLNRLGGSLKAIA